MARSQKRPSSGGPILHEPTMESFPAAGIALEDLRHLRQEAQAHRAESDYLTHEILAAEHELREDFGMSPPPRRCAPTRSFSERDLPMGHAVHAVHASLGSAGSQTTADSIAIAVRRNSEPAVSNEPMKVLERMKARRESSASPAPMAREAAMGRTPALSASSAPTSSAKSRSSVNKATTANSKRLLPQGDFLAGPCTWSVMLDRSSGEPLGVDLKSGTLEVEVIRKGGLVDKWNQVNPALTVQVGDRIQEVNGACGTAAIVAECKKLQVLQIMMLRQLSCGSGEQGSAKCAALLRKLEATREIAMACRTVLLPHMRHLFPGPLGELSAEERVVLQFLQEGYHPQEAAGSHTAPSAGRHALRAPIRERGRPHNPASQRSDRGAK